MLTQSSHRPHDEQLKLFMTCGLCKQVKLHCQWIKHHVVSK